MQRCAPLAATLAAATALAFCLPAAAQVQRQFPRNALRGEMHFGHPPDVTVNGHTARLAPGSRIRGENNMLVLSGALAGQAAIVDYTVDASGLVKDVWILTPAEAARQPWPKTVAEAQAWSFDFGSQAWSKP
jgi:hypothetical protein